MNEIEKDSVTLYISESSEENIPAFDAAKKLSVKDNAILFLAYTPEFCGFVNCGEKTFTRLDGSEILSDSIFELRCFCDKFELRWVRDEQAGRYIIISETELDGLTPEGCFYKRSGSYILWGKGTRRGGSIRLFEHRIGELPLPVEIEEKLQAGQRVYLKFDEYFKLDEYGNMIWQLERLSGLELELKTE